MNTQKIFVGGIAAAVVIFALDFVANGIVLGDRWMATLEAINPMLVESAEAPGTIATFAVVDLVWGVLLVWLYAAIRPRFGAGPMTAVYAGLFFWVVTGMVWATFAAIGMYGWGMYTLGAVVWLAISLVAAQVGAWLYTEGAAPAEAAAEM